MMGPAHFHFARRDDPEPAVQVDFIPFSMTQPARTNKHMRGKLHGQLRDYLALVTVDGPQHLARTLRLDNGPIVLRLGSDECARGWGPMPAVPSPRHSRLEAGRAGKGGVR